MRAPTLMFSFILASRLLARDAHAVPPIRALSALQAGDQGECHTVFVGRKVERVPFVVRGIMPDFLGPHRDLLLIRLLGEQAEFSGVAAGMSGSPCLVAGEVVGALSYSFGMFNKEPLAGVTPIGDMLEVLQLPPASLPWRSGERADAAGGGASSPPLHAPAETLGADWQAFVSGQASPALASGTDSARPIAVALSMAGTSPRLRERWAPYLASHGFALSAGAGAARTQGTGSMAVPGASAPAVNAGPPLAPGDSVAAVLVAGDVSMTGTGTVTWVDGDRILAFGHPFMGLGALSAPMARSHILQILASSMHSQKMPVTDDIVGEFTEDRLFAIAGTVGAPPAMVPVRGHLRVQGRAHPFSFDVSRDAFWTPRFVTMALAGALSGQLESAARGTLSATATLRLQAPGGREEVLPLRAVASGERNEEMSHAVAVALGQAVAALWRAPQAWPLPALSMAVEATFVPEVSDEQVVAIHLGDAVVAPGALVSVSVELSHFGRPNRFVNAALQVPATTSAEALRIVACDADGIDGWAERLSGGPAPRTRSQVLHALRERHAPGAIYLQMVRDGGAMQASGAEQFSELPLTAATLLPAPTTASPSAGSFVGGEKKLARPGAVHGCAEANVRLKKPVRTLPLARVRS